MLRNLVRIKSSVQVIIRFLNLISLWNIIVYIDLAKTNRDSKASSPTLKLFITDKLDFLPS